MAKNALETSFRQLQAEANIIAGKTAISGNYGVDLTYSAGLVNFHVGKTGVHYRAVCSNSICTTRFTGFVQAQDDRIIGPDYFQAPLTYIGITGELPGGTPFPYMPHIWQITFPNPGYPEE